MTTETLSVPEIHCGHCKASIEAALNPLAAVSKAVVDVEARTVTVEFDETAVDRAQLVGAIEDLGYEVPEQR